MKTGSLFSAAAQLSAVINDADPSTVAAMKDFGMKVGAAYQIYDDCLDIAGDEAVIGKTLGTDLRKGKLTLPVLKLLQAAPVLEREQYSQMIVDGRVDEMTEVLKTEVAGAPLSESILAGEELIRDAQNALSVLPPGSYTDGLGHLCDGLRELFEQVRD
jgi:octaprenyl-diphosphate synthase